MLKQATVQEDTWLATMVGLSFQGDFRTRWKGLEDAKKIEKVVWGQREDLRAIYELPARDMSHHVEWNITARTVKVRWSRPRSNLVLVASASLLISKQIDQDPKSRGSQFQKLPKSFQKRVLYRMKIPYTELPREDPLKIATKVVVQEDFHSALHRGESCYLEVEFVVLPYTKLIALKQLLWTSRIGRLLPSR